MKQLKNNLSYTLLAILVFILFISMILLKSSPSDQINLVDRSLVTITFISACIFGISIAIYPRWWKKFLRNNNKSDVLSKKNSRKLQGHHPNCINFKNHIIILRNKPRCAGCLGLIFGSVLSIFLFIFVLFFLPKQPIIILHYLFILGLVMIPLILLEIRLKKRQVIVHIFSNIILIISFFILTFSILGITGKLIYGILTIILCFFWLDTRIQLSNQRHSKICAYCMETCKTF